MESENNNEEDLELYSFSGRLKYYVTRSVSLLFLVLGIASICAFVYSFMGDIFNPLLEYGHVTLKSEDYLYFLLFLILSAGFIIGHMILWDWSKRIRLLGVALFLSGISITALLFNDFPYTTILGIVLILLGIYFFYKSLLNPPEPVETKFPLKGWLYFFSIYFMILFPIINIIILITSSSEYIPRVFRTLDFLETIFSIILIIFSIIAGVYLWKVKPNAVKVVKYFIKSVLATRAILILYALYIEFVMKPYDSLAAIFYEVLIIQMLIYGAIYSYFVTSKNVKTIFKNE